MRSRAFVDRNVHYQIYDSLVAHRRERQDHPLAGREVGARPRTARRSPSSCARTSSTTTARRSTPSRSSGTSTATARPRARPARASWRRSTSVDVVDPATVKFNLKAPFSPLLAILVDRAGMMVSRKAVEAGGRRLHPQGVQGRDRAVHPDRGGQGRPHHAREEPGLVGQGQATAASCRYLDKIIVKPITNGDVRLTNVAPATPRSPTTSPARTSPAVKTDSVARSTRRSRSFNWSSLIPNRKKGFVFEEARYVKAVSMAIDRKEILDKVVLRRRHGRLRPDRAVALRVRRRTSSRSRSRTPRAPRSWSHEVGKGPLCVRAAGLGRRPVHRAAGVS